MAGSTSTLAVKPPSFQMASTETLPLRFDTTALLGSGETPSSPSATLVDLYSGRAYTAGLSGSPSVATVFITQTVTALEAGRRYLLTITFTAAAGKIYSMKLVIEADDT